MEDRFEIVSAQLFKDIHVNDYYVNGGAVVLQDKQTGVMYLRCDGLRGSGLTVLVDKDGKPMTTFKVSI